MVSAKWIWLASVLNGVAIGLHYSVWHVDVMPIQMAAIVFAIFAVATRS